MKHQLIVLFIIIETCLMYLTLSDNRSKTSTNHGILHDTDSDFVSHPVKISVVERKPFFMRRSASHDELSIISQNSSSSSSQVEFEGFVVDVVEQVLSAGPFHVQWQVDTGRTVDSSTVPRLLAGEADIAFIGLLTDSFDDVRLMTSRALLRTSLTLLTSRHNVTLRDVTSDTSLTLGTVAHSRAERLLRRSRQPVWRQLWRRIRRGRGRSSRVPSVDVGVGRVLNDDDDEEEDFVLIVESSDAAYVSSRAPGCALTVIDQNTPVAEYRFVVVNSSSRQSELLQRVDSALVTLHQTAVIKRLYYKWWTSTDCLLHITDPDIWTSSADREAADVDETSANERIFLRAPLSAARPSSVTRDRPATTPVNHGGLDHDTQSHVTRQLVGSPSLDLNTTSRSRHMISEHQRHASDVVQSLSASTASAVRTASSSKILSSGNTDLLRRSDRDPVHVTERRRYAMNTDDGVSADPDQFDWVFMSRRSTNGSVEDEDNLWNSDTAISEQGMAVKEHWRGEVAGDVRQSTTRMTASSAGNDGQSWTVSDAACVGLVLPFTMMTMMMQMVVVIAMSRRMSLS